MRALNIHFFQLSKLVDIQDPCPKDQETSKEKMLMTAKDHAIPFGKIPGQTGPKVRNRRCQRSHPVDQYPYLFFEKLFVHKFLSIKMELACAIKKKQ